MRRILYIALLAVVPLGLLHWNETHDVPKWLIILTAIPLFITGYLSYDNDDGNLRSGPSALVLFVLGGAGILLGIVGWALRGSGSLAGLLAYAFPAGAISIVIGIATLWRGSR